MNEIVRTVKAGTLPEELRGGIDPEATVEVTVREDAPAPPADASDDNGTPRDGEGRIDLRAMMDPARPKATWAEVLASIRRHHARIEADPSLAERDPVGRVREARYGEE